MNPTMNLFADIQPADGDTLTEKDTETFFQKFQNPQIFMPKSKDTTECWYEWSDDSDRGCSDCPDDECTGHCTSCNYRPV